MIKKVILTLGLAYTMSISLIAQRVDYYQPYSPEPLPSNAPEWFKEIQKRPSGVNFHKMEKLFSNWLAKDVNARVKTLDKKPAVNFYRRWAKAFRPYAQADGRIVLPTIKEYFAQLDRDNQEEQFRASTNKWRNIGPNTTYSREGKIKDSQACIYRIAVAPSDHNILYSGAETGVVFRSSNKGETWQACDGTHNFGGAIYSIAVHPTNPNIVYVGGGIGFWKSTNAGQDWQRVKEVVGRVNSIRIAKSNPQYITLALGIGSDKHSGFYQSVDGGQTFTKTFEGICHDHELKPNNEDIIYLIAKAKGEQKFALYRSEDKGVSFTKQGSPVSNIVAGRLAVSEAPNGANYVYALVNTSTASYDSGLYGGVGKPYLLKSTDSGITWQDITIRKPNNRDPKNTFSPFVDEAQGGQGYFDMAIAVSSKNPEHLIWGLCNAYRSRNGGKEGYYKTAIGGYQRRDWSHPDIQDMVVAGDDTWMTTDGGIKYSADFFATKGEDRNQGIYASNYHGFSQGWNEDVMAGGRWHNGDVVHTARYGEGNTLHITGVEQATGHVMLSNPNKVYFSDGGVHTIPQEIGGAVTDSYGEFFTPHKPYEMLTTSNEIAFDPRYAQRLIMCPDDDKLNVYLSEDEGRSFRKYTWAEDEIISNYQFSRSNPENIYTAGIYTIYVKRGNEPLDMFFQAWEMSNSQALAPLQIAVDPHKPNTVWCTYSMEKGRVAYTEDGGATWHKPESELFKDRHLHWIVMTGDEHNGIYLGTADPDRAKVFYKDDTLEGWIDYSNGLPKGARLTRLTPFFKEGKLRAATSQGIWEIPLYNEHFRPTPQPIALNLGNGNLTATPNKEVQFDSYSIVNQNDVTKWEWEISPKPKTITNFNVRNPRVVFAYKGNYDVTLRITTEQGTFEKTVKNMITIAGNAPDNPNKETEILDKDPHATALSNLSEAKEQVIIANNILGENGEMTLRVKGLKGKRLVRIHNLKGALLRELSFSASESLIKVPAKGLQKGLYIFELRSEGYRYYGKFMIK